MGGGRSHMQYASFMTGMHEYMAESLIFNVLLNDCCSCHQWRKAKAAVSHLFLSILYNKCIMLSRCVIQNVQMCYVPFSFEMEISKYCTTDLIT